MEIIKVQWKYCGNNKWQDLKLGIFKENSDSGMKYTILKNNETFSNEGRLVEALNRYNPGKHIYAMEGKLKIEWGEPSIIIIEGDSHMMWQDLKLGVYKEEELNTDNNGIIPDNIRIEYSIRGFKNRFNTERELIEALYQLDKLESIYD